MQTFDCKRYKYKGTRVKTQTLAHHGPLHRRVSFVFCLEVLPRSSCGQNTRAAELDIRNEERSGALEEAAGTLLAYHRYLVLPLPKLAELAKPP